MVAEQSSDSHACNFDQKDGQQLKFWKGIYLCSPVAAMMYPFLKRGKISDFRN